MARSSRLPASETFEAALRAFGNSLAAECRSPHTVSAYVRDLRTLGGVLEAEPRVALRNVTPRVLDEALATPAVLISARGTPRSRGSLHRFRAAVRTFFAWAERTGRVGENAARYVKLGRLPRRTPAFLSDSETGRLRDVLAGHDDLVQRDRVVVEVFLATGIRLQELVDLDVDDIDLEGRQLHIRAKGDQEQVRFLNQKLCAILHAYQAWRRQQDRGEDGPLFVTAAGRRLGARQVARRLGHWLALAGITKHLSPHSLRHTFASTLYRQSGDLLVVQRALGHRDLATTQIYTHLSDGVLEQALEAM